MPSGEHLVTKNSKLLLIGSGDDIIMARKVIGKKERPREMMYV